MTTAIERVEQHRNHKAALTLRDLDEVLRLAKLGERVEQVERTPTPQHGWVLVDGDHHITTPAGLWAWLKGET